MIYKCDKCGLEFKDFPSCNTHEQVCGINEIFVAELFSVTQTHDESARRYKVFKKTVPLPDDFIERIKDLKEEDISEFFEEDYFDYAIDRDFNHILVEEILRGCDLQQENIERLLINDDEYYDRNALFEIKIKGSYGEIDTAYISVFKLETDKLKDQDDVNITLNKKLTTNCSW